MNKFCIFFIALAIASCEHPQVPSVDVQNAEQRPENDQSQVTLDKDDLIDFSTAGYMRSECAPPEASLTGYTVIDVTNYGAVADDGKSDRDAFLKAITAATGQSYSIDDNGWIVFNHKEQANAIIYFPEGEYILHTAEDDVNGVSRSIQIRCGNLIVRGAGKDKTKLVMQSPNLPKDPSKLYSSPEMIQIKHNSAHSSFQPAVTITADVKKGDHSVTVNTSAPLSKGDWVCLYLKNNDPELITSQVAPHTPESWWEIVKNGVEIIDYHQIRSIDGNKVTFYAPVVTDVPGKYSMEIHKFPHYENVGVEDLTFKGFAKSDFIHHGSWKDDGAYKPISFNRLTNSWIRRVGFESTSEACSIIASANVSAYNIEMTGDRGHSSIRSQASSRVLIAGTTDLTSGGKGNFHGVGVSRHTMGTVLYKNRWGDDSCFESHATQPRATLIDCCSGGWHRGHQGGDSDQVPHHLSDLVIWNFTATQASETTDFLWWDKSITWWKFLPPVIGGFQPEGMVKFVKNGYYDIDTEDITSLFEYQLKSRLGMLPSWINTINN